MDGDETLFWFEDTPHGKEYFESATVSEDKKIRRKNAHFDISKTHGHGNVQFKYDIEYGFIWIIETRTSIKNIEKYFELAYKLDSKLFKNQTWVNEEKMQDIRDEYKNRKG